jgi:hypothetical protein
MLAVTYSIKSVFKAIAPDATPLIAEQLANASDHIVHASDVREAIAIRWGNSTKTSMPPEKQYNEALALGYTPPFTITPNEAFRDMPEEQRMPKAREKVTIHEWAANVGYSQACPLDPPYYTAPQVRVLTQELLDAENLTYGLTTDATSYLLNQDVKVQFSLTNPTTEAITLKFPTQKQIDYMIYDAENTTVYTWSDHQSFPSTASEITVNAQDTWSQTITHTQDMYRLLPGTYEIEATVVGYYNTRTSQSIIKIDVGTTPEA